MAECLNEVQEGPAQLEMDEAEARRFEEEENERRQEDIKSDLILANVMEDRDENLNQTIIDLIHQLRVHLSEDEIIFSKRCGVYIDPEMWVGIKLIQPRCILLRLTSRNKCEEIINAVRSNPVVVTTVMGLPPPPQVIFIMERLTRTNRDLYNRVRLLCLRMNWDDAWFSEGKIFVRQAIGYPTYHIRTNRDILEVFGEIDF